MLRTLLSSVLLLAALALTVGTASADLILLKDGRRFEGTILKETATEVLFETRFGELKFPRSEISRLERGLTPSQEFNQRWKDCKSANDYFVLGQWAAKKQLRADMRRAMKKVVSFEPDHAGANKALGLVPYNGRWVKPEERERLKAKDHSEDMRQRGLVQHEGEWVTLAEKKHLDAGEVYFEGRWLKPGDLERARGLEQLDGEWVVAGRAASIQNARAVLEAGGAGGEIAVGTSVLAAGPFDQDFLQEIVDGLERGGEWVARLMRPEEGKTPAPVHAARVSALHEFYVFGQDSEPYLRSVDPLVGLTDTVPPGWGEAVKKTHGFYFSEPRAVSSARCMGRPEAHLAGHSFHHRGHILINQHLYDGRLLPPWFDEGFACLFEFRVHQCNQVMCVAGLTTVGTESRTNAKAKEVYVFNQKEFRAGAWKGNLRSGLLAEDKALVDFDRLAQKRFGELGPADVAMSMAIVAWIEQHGEGSLRRFQESLKGSAPRAPQRVQNKTGTRQARYDAAFQEAVGMGWRAADKEWRAWFLSTGQ
ncbi:MAG: hypothetical protein QGI93_10625 [Planctomycetota bacterium]|nr:hypothetical protein [Planctomycetota bacterium]